MPILRRLSWPRDVVITTDPHKRVFDPRSLTAYSGTAQAGSTNTLTLKASGSPTSLLASRRTLVLTGGAGSTQTRKITHYDGATKVATVSPRWRTNMLTRSEELNHANWLKFHGFINPNQALDSTGALTADDMVSDAGSTATTVSQQVTTVAGLDYVFSVEFSTASTLKIFYMYICWNGGPYGVHRSMVIVNISTLTLGSGIHGDGPYPTFSLQNLGGGWYRVNGFAKALLSGSSAFTLYEHEFTGDGVKFLRFARAQCEQASEAGDYIKTEASAITVPNATTTYNIPLG